MSTEYGKIDTLYARDDKFVVDVAQLLRPVYGTINQWSVTEKVDGNNIRLVFTRDPGNDDRMLVQIRGKTDNASIHPTLLDYLTVLIKEILAEVEDIMATFELETFVLYGEGIGPKIGKVGHRYSTKPGFVLFDVVVSGGIFLAEEVVTETARKLGLRRAPVLGVMNLTEFTDLAREGFYSHIAEDAGFRAEGVVARTIEPLYDNRGQRLIVKLKARDWGRTNV
jgi:ATP-dependent RNA circularization protein (DNA/RNA ligase family)